MDCAHKTIAIDKRASRQTTKHLMLAMAVPCIVNNIQDDELDKEKSEFQSLVTQNCVSGSTSSNMEKGEIRQEITLVEEKSSARKRRIQEESTAERKRMCDTQTFTSKRHRRKKQFSMKELLDESQYKLFQVALDKKFDSPEDFLRLKCIHVRTKGTATALDRCKEELHLHVAELWNKQRGLCAFTGRRLVWKKEDILKFPRLVASVVRKDNMRAWEIGNIVIVCAAVSSLLSEIGIYKSHSLALETMAFVQFKRSRSLCDRSPDVFSAWDDNIRKTNAMAPWDGLSKTTKAKMHALFFDRRIHSSDIVDQRSRDEEWSFAWHCVDLYVLQRCRCAITGMLLEDRSPNSLVRPSIDRIDNTLAHVKGNVVISSVCANRGRLELSIPEFYDVLSDAVGWFSNTTTSSSLSSPSTTTQ